MLNSKNIPSLGDTELVKNEEMISSLPLKPVTSDNVDYLADFTSDYIPGEQLRQRYRIPKNGQDASSGQDVFTIDPCGTYCTIDGSKCFLEARLRAEYSSGAPILAADDVYLAPECNNILFQTIQLTVNEQLILSSNRQDIARHVMRRITTSNGDRAANCYRNEFMGEDSELGDKAVLGPDALYKNPLTDKKPFYIDRPLDDLPMFGQLDSDIPPNSRITFTLYYTPDVSRMFRTAEGADTLNLKFDYIDFYWVTNRLTTKAGDELQNRMKNTNNTFLYVTDQWKADIIPNGNISAGQSTYSPVLGTFLQSTFDVAFILLFPASSYNPPAGSANFSKSLYTKTWGNVNNFHIKTNGRALRSFYDLTVSPTAVTSLYKGIVNSLSSKWDAAPYRGVSPLDFIEYMNGPMAMFPIDLRYVNSEDVQHPEISNLSIDINFGNGGASEDMVPIIVTKSKAIYQYLPDGKIDKIR